MSWRGTIPIYINNFNWLTWPRRLASYFAAIPRVEVIIVDNASTFPPLLEWYEHDCPYKVIRLPQNGGKSAPWLQGAVLQPSVHSAMFGSRYYAVTDADLSFEQCPTDLIELLTDGVNHFPECNKVGVSLEIDDLPCDSIFGDQPKSWEKQFWTRRLSARFFRAAIDTTFALYSIDTPHRKAMSCDGNAIRTDRPYTARHMPWYLKKHELTDEHQFYLRNTKEGMWSRRGSAYITSSSGDAGTSSPALSHSVDSLYGITAADIGEHEPDWRVSFELLRILDVLLSRLRPQSILETGAGLSTLLFFRYQAEHPTCVLCCHDQSGPWSQRTIRSIERHGFDAGAITTSQVRDGFYTLMSAHLNKGRPFALVLIDGPSNSSGRASPGCKAFLIDNGGPETVYVIDDTNRPHEASVVEFLSSHHCRAHYRRFVVRDRRFRWRTSTLLIPRAMVERLTESKVFTELATPIEAQ